MPNRDRSKAAFPLCMGIWSLEMENELSQVIKHFMFSGEADAQLSQG